MTNNVTPVEKQVLLRVKSRTLTELIFGDMEKGHEPAEEKQGRCTVTPATSTSKEIFRGVGEDPQPLEVVTAETAHGPCRQVRQKRLKRVCW